MLNSAVLVRVLFEFCIALLLAKRSLFVVVLFDWPILLCFAVVRAPWIVAENLRRGSTNTVVYKMSLVYQQLTRT